MEGIYRKRYTYKGDIYMEGSTDTQKKNTYSKIQILRNIYIRRIYIYIQKIYKQGGYKYWEDIYIKRYTQRKYIHGEMQIQKKIDIERHIHVETD